MSIRVHRLLIAAGVAAAVCANAGAQLYDTSFTYQGRFEAGGQPANGTYQFLVRLLDAPTGGTQIGSTSIINNVTVTDGLFNITVTPDEYYLKRGIPLWVQTEIRGPGDPSYTVLTPRQPLRAAPYATLSRFPWAPSNDGQDAVFTGTFVGINRDFQITPSEVFGISTDFGQEAYGGMYISTVAPDGKPFYGYSTGDGLTAAWTYYDGSDSTWRVNNVGDRMTVTNTGRVGVGTTEPAERLHVIGNVYVDQGSLFLSGGYAIHALDGELRLRWGQDYNLFSEGIISNVVSSTRSANTILGNHDSIDGLNTTPLKSIGDGAIGGFIGGGGSRTSVFTSVTLQTQRIYDNYGTIAGGNGNRVGTSNGDPYAEQGATVSGGLNNIASGQYSTVPGGELNHANGAYAFAAGRRAKANGPGVFVLADSSNYDFSVTGSNALAARFTGGVYFYTSLNGSGFPNAGAFLNPGSGSWTSLSDVNSKQDFEAVDAGEILDRVAALPVQRWSYKSQDGSVRHIGPTAQDFHAAFAVGDDPKGITTVDADGVALAAIKGLNAKLEATVEAQREQIEAQRQAIEALARRLEALERAAD